MALTRNQEPIPVISFRSAEAIFAFSSAAKMYCAALVENYTSAPQEEEVWRAVIVRLANDQGLIVLAMAARMETYL